jgi:putative transposase
MALWPFSANPARLGSGGVGGLAFAALGYLVAIMDWLTRKVLARRISNMLVAELCLETLNEAMHKFGLPEITNTDQGIELVSCDLDLRAHHRGVVLDFSQPGKPTDTAFIEAFNGRVRAECPNQHWFLTLAYSAEKLAAWRRYENEERPHGAIGNKVPILLTKPGGVTSPSP